MPPSIRTWSQDSRRALHDYHIEIDEELILETHLSAEGGYRAGLDLLARQNRPTAILARTDRLAIGAMRAAWELAIEIPDDLSIIGYDDEPDARFSAPGADDHSSTSIRDGHAGGNIAV